MAGKFSIVVRAALAVLILGVVGIASYQAIYKDTNQSLTANLPIGADFTLTDDSGNPITEQAFANQPIAVFFGFTHCPEVCPTTLYELAGWLEELGADGANIKTFFITVDPERDRPDIMKSYVENFTDRITGITGDPEKVYALAKAWHIYWNKVPLDDGDYTMDHTASIFLVDGDGNFKGTISFGESNDVAIEKLRRLAKG